MYRTAVAADLTQAPAPIAEAGVRLSEARKGCKGVILRVGADDGGALEAEELERRLLEFGFVEGARVEILHEGLFGRDPIAVRLDDMRIALRRREAHSILVRLEQP